MDKIVDGGITSDDISDIGEKLNEGEELDEITVNNMFEDLSVIRYNYTMDTLIRTAMTYLIRPKSSNARALRDYKRAMNVLKFVIKETEELYEAEQDQ
jgi:hypothetical protein